MSTRSTMALHASACAVLARRIHRIVHRSRLLGDVTMPATGVFALGGRPIQARLPTKTEVPLFATIARIIPLDVVGEILGETLRLFDVTTWTSPSIPSSSEVYRGYNLRTPGSVSSAACIASKSVAGNEASARAKKRSVEAWGEGIVSAERARECGVAKHLATTQRRERSTWLRCRHVDQVNTCVTRCVLLCGTALVPRYLNV